MPVRSRRSSSEASSRISPPGSIARRIAAARLFVAGEPAVVARSVSSGNFACVSRNASRSQPAVSASEATSSSSPGSSTAPGLSNRADQPAVSASPPNPISLPCRSQAIASASVANSRSRRSRSVPNDRASIARPPSAEVVCRRSSSRSLPNSRSSSAERVTVPTRRRACRPDSVSAPDARPHPRACEPRAPAGRPLRSSASCDRLPPRARAR